MRHTSNKYEIDLLSDFIKFMKMNNYQIIMKPSIKSYEKLNNKDGHEHTMVKFHFDVVNPSDDRILQEIKMFVLTNIKEKN